MIESCRSNWMNLFRCCDLIKDFWIIVSVCVSERVMWWWGRQGSWDFDSDSDSEAEEEEEVDVAMAIGRRGEEEEEKEVGEEKEEEE